MFLRKRENKKHHPYALLTVFTLAAVGVMGIAKKSKTFIKDKAKCVKNFFCKECGEDARS